MASKAPKMSKQVPAGKRKQETLTVLLKHPIIRSSKCHKLKTDYGSI